MPLISASTTPSGAPGRYSRMSGGGVAATWRAISTGERPLRAFSPVSVSNATAASA